MSLARKLGVGVIGAGVSCLYGPNRRACVTGRNRRGGAKADAVGNPRKSFSTHTEHCASKFHIPHKTTNPQEVIANPRVDIVFILTSDDSHAPLAIASIEAGKFVFIEKPLTLSIPSAQSIIAAEKAAGGSRVFVGYMRRYAPSYLEAFKREVASIPRILYARVRDFSGPNANFVSQSGTFQLKANDVPPAAASESKGRLEALFAEAFPEQTITDTHRQYCRFLGSLGSHDFSLMRETLGVPEEVVAVSANHPFYSSMMTFRNEDGSAYSVTYESGIDEVPVFDSHLSVYGARKRVTVKYSSPYVKGLPITVEVEETNENGEVQHRSMLSSYQDAYTSEFLELYESLVNGKPIKTTAEDALQDISLFDKMFKVWAAQKSKA